MRTHAMNATKALLLGIAAAAAAFFFAPNQASQPQPAEATPDGILFFNGGICLTLGVAFGGLPAATALSACLNFDDENLARLYVSCVRSGDDDRNGTKDCDGDPGERTLPSDFAALDLDGNQVHPGTEAAILAFVNDDANVRFITDTGYFVNKAAADQSASVGQDIYCEGTNSNDPPPLNFLARTGDPDCDGDESTEGDGLVTAILRVDEDDIGETGTVTVIQEGVGFPYQFTVVGAPETITMSPLFGKTVIQRGSTPPTGQLSTLDENDNGRPDNLDPIPDTACNLSLSVAGVLGANQDPRKVIVVTKALDDDGNEIAGALINWAHSVAPYLPGAALTVTVGSTLIDPEFAEEGFVSLPQTPTVDTGALGLAFPQLVCGGDETGELTLENYFALTTSDESDQNEVGRISLTVVGDPGNVSLAADPPTVACDGVATSTITATVTTDEGGNVADGTDVEFDVSVLGTTNPLVGNTAAGKATTVVTPLSGSGRGVPVIVTVQDVQASILVNCAEGTAPAAGGAAPPPAGGAAPGSGRPTGSISGPDTGSAGLQGTAGTLSWWPMLGLGAAALVLGGFRLASRRID